MWIEGQELMEWGLREIGAVGEVTRVVKESDGELGYTGKYSVHDSGLN